MTGRRETRLGGRDDVGGHFMFWSSRLFLALAECANTAGLKEGMTAERLIRYLIARLSDHLMGFGGMARENNDYHAAPGKVPLLRGPS